MTTKIIASALHANGYYLDAFNNIQRVEKLEQNTPSKKNPFEVDVVATKESLRKLKETILGIFR